MTTKTDITLLPCPFCGGEAEIDTRQGYLALGTGRLGNRIAAYCRSCNADMGVCVEDVPDIEPEQVADMWNRRAAVEADRPGRMPSDEEILHIWGAFVNEPTEEYPLTDADKITFARALLSRYSNGQPDDQIFRDLEARVQSLDAECARLEAENDRLKNAQPAAPSGLGFRIEERAGIRVLAQDAQDGLWCRPASETECALWDALMSGQPAASKVIR